MKSLRLPGFRHRFKVSGLNLERFLNLLLKADIPLLAIRRADSRTLFCECYSADLKTIVSLAGEKGWRVQETVPLHMSARLHFFRRRPGIPAGVILAFFLVLILSQHIWLIDINGAGSYRSEIASYLSECGYRSGTRRNSVDASQLEKQLTYRYPEIAWFQVYVNGMRMVVDVTPSTQMSGLLSGIPGDVKASRGGIVVSVQVFAGTSKVKPGDPVTEGQVLIEGSERSADGENVPVQARGTVVARCWDSHTVAIPTHQIISEETGKERVFSRIHTPIGDFPAQSATPDFLASNTYIETLPVGGTFFPICFQRIICREVSMQYEARTIETVRQEAAQAALKSLKARHFGDEIIDKWVDYCMIEDGSLAATATVEWLMDISGTSVP